MKLEETMKSDALRVSEALRHLLSCSDPALLGLFEAESYSVMAGGKRIRPIIALMFCRMFGGNDQCAIPYACAIEMIHTASLIHDDLPAVDNDDLRRGMPTNHKVFGEATALLAADGLLMDSFGVVASNPYLDSGTNLEAVKYLSKMTGTRGLVGGEYIDVMAEGRECDLALIEEMDDLKTGALIRASAVLGALAAGVPMNDERMKDVLVYADSVGRAFQIVDDLLDVFGDAESLGKNPGQDATMGKTTYLSFYTPKEARAVADKLTEAAIASVYKYENSEMAVELARRLVNRSF